MTSKPGRTLWWSDETPAIMCIDQTLLPSQESVLSCHSVDTLIDAIRSLAIRGAPALGVAGAYGIALSACTAPVTTMEAYFSRIREDAARIRSARPTAVNLSWGVDRVISAVGTALSPQEARSRAITEARRVDDDDAASCHAIGLHGARLLPDRCTILTHCNAGALACSEWGTALGVIRSARELGKDIEVIACETRPLFQGARLTAWELARDAIPVTVIPDSAAASLMRRGRVDCVITGADRITTDVVFNKIGTYMHAVAARHHRIPFYVAAPHSTFDPQHSEEDIVIEERPREEVASPFGFPLVPEGVPVANYAFDATPLVLVDGIITERGVFVPPYRPDDLMAGARTS